jgi:hypothetical protein
MNSVVSLSFFGVGGQEITFLKNIFLHKGSHKYILDGCDLRPGIYIYKLSDEKKSEQGKFVVK